MPAPSRRTFPVMTGTEPDDSIPPAVKRLSVIVAVEPQQLDVLLREIAPSLDPERPRAAKDQRSNVA